MDQGVSLDAQQAASSARSEIDLWTPAHTDAVFAQESIGRLLFTSLRDGRDVALVNGGAIRNRWDLPLTAAGKPFSYEGKIELFAVIAESTGLLRVACAAIQQPGNPVSSQKEKSHETSSAYIASGYCRLLFNYPSRNGAE